MDELTASSVTLATVPAEGRTRSRVQVLLTTDGVVENGGKRFELTRSDLEVYARYINEHGLKEDGSGGLIPVDYDHRGASDGSTVAAGWFVAGTAEVVDRENGAELWAEVEWTPQAAQEIRDGRYRFLSGEFTFGQRKGGILRQAREFIAATLTNRPFFRQLQPVMLADTLADADVVTAAVWSTAYINDLPDSAFLYIEPGGRKDDTGRTVPRSLRHFPVRDANGRLDLPHLRNALARIPQSNLPADVKERIARQAQRLLESANRQETREEDPDMDLTVIARALGVEPEESAIVDAVKARDERIAELEETVRTLKPQADEAETLRARVERLEQERENDRKERIIADGMRARKFVPAQREALMALSLEALTALAEATPAGRAEIGSGGEAEAEPDIVEARKRFPDADDESLRVQLAAERLLKEEGKELTYENLAYALQRVAA
jgi:phage I-like protein